MSSSARLVVVAIALLVQGCGLTRGFVYYPQGDAGTNPPDSRSEDEPAVEDVFFKSADGTNLHGWLARFRGATRAVLSCHGNAGNVAMRAEEILQLRRFTRAHVLMFDYRGFGRSDGSPEEEGIREDASAALAALEGATGVPRERTTVLGHSLGGAVAIDLAARTPSVAAIVVVSSFTSIGDMARHLAFPGAGILLSESWDSRVKIPAVRSPKLFVHGDADEVIPFEQGVALYTAAAEPKRFVRVDGGRHNSIMGPFVLFAIGAFIDDVTPESPKK